MNMLKVGSVGPQVSLLQGSLNFLQMASPPLVVDGQFGRKTKAAVVKLQGQFNLGTDGIVGPLTTHALVAATFLALMPSQ